jgi:hypothetical protein
MPRDGAVTLSDLRDRGLDRVTVSCAKCPRHGTYRLDAALERWGDAKLPDILADLTRDCPKGKGSDAFDQCGARFLGI